MAIRKRKWKTGEGVKTAWSYVFDAPGSTRTNRKQIFESGFASKKEAQDAETARRVKAQKDYELQSATPVAIPGTLAGLLKEFFSEHGAKALAAKTLQRYREMADYLDADLSPCRCPKSSRFICLANGIVCLPAGAGGGKRESRSAARPSAISRVWCRAPTLVACVGASLN